MGAKDIYQKIKKSHPTTAEEIKAKLAEEQKKIAISKLTLLAAKNKTDAQDAIEAKVETKSRKKPVSDKEIVPSRVHARKRKQTSKIKTEKGSEEKDDK